ncbi:uncharacterized protein AMSG_04935 [Thecamonas trahens ATCC 50062]|uniref:Potassium channel domain-containing protein n=1 Tax=Thecamonas trahens ATCC 50062 TaxID=461836 RepID=A0A0L0D7X8_THETB|nr:hypothetical protein AMSG_04935 [Thecamonas trahens ATCC 50062]KNC48487.1 hypothetical protein AMSG_04935 [Thecamonas trahens ATCC 50062]|eukprot:XP_013758599.1 hypothetical protein AMSG_04935 [Thecamonas trahens ATCC 50062]
MPRRKRHKIPRFITQYLLVWSVLWQAALMLILTLTEAGSSTSGSHAASVDIGIGVLVVFQSVMLLAIVMTSIKLTKQLLHGSATGVFLMQSYLSTVLLFAGVYTLLYRIRPSSFRGLPASFAHETTDGSELSHSSTYAATFIRMLYFSLTAMTTAGFGDIVPAVWYTYFAVSLQLLISVVYTAVIFARGVEALSRAHQARAAAEARAQGFLSTGSHGFLATGAHLV